MRQAFSLNLDLTDLLNWQGMKFLGSAWLPTPNLSAGTVDVVSGFSMGVQGPRKGPHAYVASILINGPSTHFNRKEMSLRWLIFIALGSQNI